MELSPKQQAIEFIKKSQKILLVSHVAPAGDALGSLVAFGEVLKKLKKEVTVVASGGLPENLRFLPLLENIQGEPEGSRDFIIKLDVKENPVGKLSYSVEEGALKIIVNSENGVYTPGDVSFEKGSYNYDLVIVLDTADVDKIDRVYDENRELFLETPVINIDHHAANEQYGTVNFVDPQSTSTAEILVSLIEALGVKLDEKIATCLLAGIISDTGSFKNQNTTPKSLTVSAQLLAAGAAQQEIIKNLYRVKSISNLKLWGKVLSRLNYEKESRFIYSYVTNEDIAELGSRTEDLKDVMEELTCNSPEADVVLFLSENEKGKIRGSLFGQRGTDVLTIAELFGGTGDFQNASFDLEDTDMEGAVSTVAAKISEIRGKKLGMERPDQNKRVILPLQKLNKNAGHMEEEVEKSIVREIQNVIEEEQNGAEKSKLSGETISTANESEEDVIAKAIDSLEREKAEKEQEEKAEDDAAEIEGLSSLKEVFKNKFSKEKKVLGSEVFKDENDEEIAESHGEIVREDTDEGEVRVWRAEE